MMPDNEDWYDSEIAPKLADLCRACQERGIPFISVEIVLVQNRERSCRAFDFANPAPKPTPRTGNCGTCARFGPEIPEKKGYRKCLLGAVHGELLFDIDPPLEVQEMHGCLAWKPNGDEFLEKFAERPGTVDSELPCKPPSHVFGCDFCEPCDPSAIDHKGRKPWR